MWSGRVAERILNCFGTSSCRPSRYYHSVQVHLGKFMSVIWLIAWLVLVNPFFSHHLHPSAVPELLDDGKSIGKLCLWVEVIQPQLIERQQAANI